MQFVPYPKTPRLNREVCVTEKLDGTNCQIVIARHDPSTDSDMNIITVTDDQDGVLWSMRVGSRSRWVTPGKTTDNYGFAQWCLDHSEQLFLLGEGNHFGEWWGQGIQRNYGLTERRFSLFNVVRWGHARPACCDVVPVLYMGPFDTGRVAHEVDILRHWGSRAVPGFMSPEGLIVFHTAAGKCFKVTVDHDEQHKGQA
jgi:hypothetical protein